MRNKLRICFWICGTLFFFYLFFYYYTGQHEACITQNLITGQMKMESRAGHHFTMPWVQASKLNLLPVKVCVVSATRNVNCKLVKFNPEKWEELIKWEGYHYYWWYNRISFNFGQPTYRGFRNLMLGHAYGENRCSCVEILSEINSN